MTASDTLISLVRARAQQRPDGVACGFSDTGDSTPQTLTRAEFDMAARRVAVQVGTHVAPGGRAVLVFEPGLDFVAAFFGCLFAGVVAVPVYPPTLPRLDAGVAHVARIARDVEADVVLTSALLIGALERSPQWEPRIALTINDGVAVDPESWRDPGVRPSDLAMIQYTSGSTTEPRGVALTHANLVHNLEAIHWFLREPERCVMVSWLPMYHDMGLIGTVMYPLVRGWPTYLMSPIRFLQRPARWLGLISRVRATVSGAPNFAYELCVRRVSDGERATLDLSSWDIAFNGAEPVRPATMRRFEEGFASCGLRPNTIAPCYGMAEASLLISGFRRGEGQRCAPPMTGLNGTIDIACCGMPPPGHEILIVDPQRRVVLSDGNIGEIWFRSPSLARGYWNRPEETSAAWVTLPDDAPSARRCLRTGDLGFLCDGELFVTGRIKDLLVIRGRNVQPHDVEDAATRAGPMVRAGGGVGFAFDGPAGEAVGLIQETTAVSPEDLEMVARALRRQVIAELHVAVDAVWLVAPRSIAKTSSGKVRRRATRDALLAGNLSVLFADHDAKPAPMDASDGHA